MPTNANWLRGGLSVLIRSAVSGWLQKIFLCKPAGKYGSYLGGVLSQNSGGFLVRDDRLPPMN